MTRMRLSSLADEFDPDITSVVFVDSEEPAEDVRKLFRKITRIGGIENPHSREYGTSVYLLQDPAYSFNKFWKMRISELDSE